MPRPSDPLLRWLRKLLDERKITVPALAEKAAIERTRMRRLLAGHEAMTVDELLQISKALSLSPTDFGLAGVEGPVADEPVAELAEADPGTDELPGVAVRIDALGNHPRQLFEVGFALQCDFLFLATGAMLEGSGVPNQVLSRYRDRDLPIKLDAAYHEYNNPRYDDACITLTLSFDALYECRFPWTAIKQLVFYPAAPPPPSEEEPEEEEPPPRKGRPFLRLVE